MKESNPVIFPGNKSQEIKSKIIMHGAGGSGLTMEPLNMLLSPTTHHYDSSMWLSLIMNIENQYHFAYLMSACWCVSVYVCVLYEDDGSFEYLMSACLCVAE